VATVLVTCGHPLSSPVPPGYRLHDVMSCGRAPQGDPRRRRRVESASPVIPPQHSSPRYPSGPTRPIHENWKCVGRYCRYGSKGGDLVQVLEPTDEQHRPRPRTSVLALGEDAQHELPARPRRATAGRSRPHDRQPLHVVLVSTSHLPGDAPWPQPKNTSADDGTTSRQDHVWATKLTRAHDQLRGAAARARADRQIAAGSAARPQLARSRSCRRSYSRERSPTQKPTEANSG